VNNKSTTTSPKNPPALPGAIEAKYVRCGNAGCHCARGELHGPYYRRAYRTGGQRRRRYVRLAALDATRQAVATWRSARERQRAERLAAGTLRALLRVYDRLSDDIIAVLEG
jgi:hypothetical protein